MINVNIYYIDFAFISISFTNAIIILYFGNIHINIFIKSKEVLFIQWQFIYYIRFIDFCWYNTIILVTMQLDLIPGSFGPSNIIAIYAQQENEYRSEKNTNLHL